MVVVSLHTIMSATSSCQPHHQVISWEVKEPGSAWFRGWNDFWARNLLYIQVRWLPGSRKGGSVFPRFRASIWESIEKKCQRNVKKPSGSEWPQICAPEFRDFRSEFKWCPFDGVSACYAGLQLAVEKAHWHGCSQERSRDAVTLLLSGIAAGGCCENVFLAKWDCRSYRRGSWEKEAAQSRSGSEKKKPRY